MKLTELTYFFEAYCFPAMRHFYPTDTALWQAFQEKESRETVEVLVAEIAWLLAQPPAEHKQIRRYLHQVGIMGSLRFDKDADMLAFFKNMKDFLV